MFSLEFNANYYLVLDILKWRRKVSDKVLQECEGRHNELPNLFNNANLRRNGTASGSVILESTVLKPMIFGTQNLTLSTSVTSFEVSLIVWLSPNHEREAKKKSLEVVIATLNLMNVPKNISENKNVDDE